MDNEKLIAETYKIARRAMNKGNHPFGALLFIDGEIALTAENSVITDRDITKHAELNLVSKAVRKFDQDTLSGSTLYTSTEPCAMCSGAIFWAGISNIVYGCSSSVLGSIAGDAFVVPCRDLFEYGNREISVTGPILEEEGAVIHREFW